MVVAQFGDKSTQTLIYKFLWDRSFQLNVPLKYIADKIQCEHQKMRNLTRGVAVSSERLQYNWVVSALAWLWEVPHRMMFWILGPWLVALFWKILKTLRGKTYLGLGPSESLVLGPFLYSAPPPFHFLSTVINFCVLPVVDWRPWITRQKNPLALKSFVLPQQWKK